MKKIALLVLALVFVLQAPGLARTKYDKWGHKIEPVKKSSVHKVSAAAKTENAAPADPAMVQQQVQQPVQEPKEEKVKVKNIDDGFGRDIGKAVRNGDGDDFTMYNARGRKMGTYVEDKKGNGKYYDLRGREIRVRRSTQDIK